MTFATVLDNVMTRYVLSHLPPGHQIQKLQSNDYKETTVDTSM